MPRYERATVRVAVVSLRRAHHLADSLEVGEFMRWMGAFGQACGLAVKSSGGSVIREEQGTKLCAWLLADPSRPSALESILRSIRAALDRARAELPERTRFRVQFQVGMVEGVCGLELSGREIFDVVGVPVSRAMELAHQSGEATEHPTTVLVDESVRRYLPSDTLEPVAPGVWRVSPTRS
jgi:class 3 adenylate cyclase